MHQRRTYGMATFARRRQQCAPLRSTCPAKPGAAETGGRQFMTPLSVVGPAGDPLAAHTLMCSTPMLPLRPA